MHAGIRYHFLEAGNLAALLDLESALHVAFAGVESRWLYRAICQDALQSGGRVVCLVSEADGQVAGFVMAFVNAAAYWKEFMLRRPVLALGILASRLWRKTAQAGAPGSAAPQSRVPFETGEAPGSWAESNDRIAKIQFIGVAPSFRGRGIGVELYRLLAVHLRERGLARIDARIAADNTASIKLHYAAGWKFYPDAHGIFAMYPLSMHPDARKVREPPPP
jgi:ribosomal protein S18 acetylase RimI-like enzyme